MGHCLFWSGEDDIHDTLVPRFIRSGGDLRKIHFISGITKGGKKQAFNPSLHMDAMLEACGRLQSQGVEILYIGIDPVVAVTGKADSHRNAETRNAMQAFLDFIREINCAGVGIHHVTKGFDNEEAGQ